MGTPEELPERLPDEYLESLQRQGRSDDHHTLEAVYPRQTRAYPFGTKVVWRETRLKRTVPELSHDESMQAQEAMERARVQEVLPTTELDNPFYQYFLRKVEFGSVQAFKKQRRGPHPRAVDDYPLFKNDGLVALKRTPEVKNRPSGFQLPHEVLDATESLGRGIFRNPPPSGLRWRVAQSLFDPDRFVLIPCEDNAAGIRVAATFREELPDRGIVVFESVLLLREFAYSSPTEREGYLFVKVPRGTLVEDDARTDRLDVVSIDFDPQGNLICTRPRLDSTGSVDTTLRLHPDRDTEFRRFVETTDPKDLRQILGPQLH